jgi:hypothetical protein
MLSRSRLLCVLLLILPDTALGQQAGVRFVSQSCHTTFSRPADWEVVPDTSEPDNTCRFLVRPRDWQQRLIASDSVDVYTILVRIVEHDVWSEVPESGFERRGAGWVVLGRQGLERPADTVSGPGWRGLRGIATVGCFREEGAYAGLCDAPSAVVGTTARSLVLIAGSRSEDVFDRILATLRFQ